MMPGEKTNVVILLSREQIEVNPLEHDVNRVLGRTLCEQYGFPRLIPNIISGFQVAPALSHGTNFLSRSIVNKGTLGSFN